MRCLARAGDAAAARAHVDGVRGAVPRASSGARPTRAWPGAPTSTAPPDRRRWATGRPPPGSSRPAAPRSTPARSSPGVACLRHGVRRGARASATPRCWPARSPRSAWRSCTPSAAATRRGPRCCTRRSPSPRSPGSATSPRRCAASSATSRCRPAAACRPAAGCCAPAQLAADDEERAAVLGRPRHGALGPRALRAGDRACCESSIAIARGCGDERRAAWSLAILGRALRAARRAARRPTRCSTGSLALVRADRLDRVPAVSGGDARRGRAARSGDPDHAAALLEHAFAARLPARRPVLGGDGRPRAGAWCTRPRASARRRSPGCASRDARGPRRRPVHVDPRVLPRRAGRASRSTTARPSAPGPSPGSSGSRPAATCASSSSAPRCTAPRLGDPAGGGVRAAARRGDRQPRPARASSRPRRRDHTRASHGSLGAFSRRRRPARDHHRPRSAPMTTTTSADLELKARHRAMWASGDYPSMVETFLAAARARGSSRPAASRRASACSTSPPAPATRRSRPPRPAPEVAASDLTPELLEAGRGARRRRGRRARLGRRRTPSSCPSRTSPSTSSCRRSA